MTKVSGLRALEVKLKRLPKSVRSAIKQALAESADDIVSTQKHLAPVSPGGTHGWPPGQLRDSIVATFGDGTVPKYAAFAPRSSRHKSGRRIVRSNDPDLSVTITAGDSVVRYAHLVEFGTHPHPQGGKFKGTMHPGTAAQAFFYPGYRVHKKRVKARISRAINRATKSIAAGGA
ncbi:MAG: HK97-gp10 family putative phage morphogenesis protein [Devosia sp.]